jgi:hypothetical protein
MVTQDNVPAYAKLSLPSWIWGNNPAQFFRDAELRTLRLEPQKDDWKICTNERYFNTKADLISVADIATPGRRSRFNLIAGMANKETFHPNTEHALPELQRRANTAEKTKDIVDMVSFYQLQTMVAPTNELENATRTTYDWLQAVTLESDPSKRAFPNSSVHVVRRHPAIGLRLKLIEFLLRAAYDEEVRDGNVAGLIKSNQSGALIFASSGGLHDGTALLDAYIAPLMAALTPAVWALPVTRPLGVIIYSLGQPLRGIRADAAELLQALPLQGSVETVKFPTLTANAGTSAINWWIERLNLLFAELTNPTAFTDTTETYVAIKHLHAVLSVEQLFRRVNSIQVAHRDANARRVLFFTVLDTLNRLLGPQIEQLCLLSYAKKTLDEIRASMPSEAAEILLPTAERAVSALERVQDGFFIQRQLGYPNVRLIEDSGNAVDVAPEDAAAQYVKVLRDATHGHGANKDARKPRVNALLANHDGNVPHDLGLLGYLYLLKVLCVPNIIRNRFYASGRT